MPPEETTMLNIRTGQMRVFEKAAADRFEDELVNHFKQFAPKHSAVIGEAGVRQVIRLGRARANKYGFTYRGPVRFYVEMMFMFGSDFDTDPQLPWAAAILNRSAASDQLRRADRLYDKTGVYLKKISGPNHTYSIEALRKLSRARIEDYPTSGANFEDVVVKGLQDIYPQKCRYLGELSLRGLVEIGLASANDYSVTTEKGMALFVALTFALGHSFASDPLFPWISSTLNDPHVDDANERAERLYTKVKLYLKHALTYLEQQRANVHSGNTSTEQAG